MSNFYFIRGLWILYANLSFHFTYILMTSFNVFRWLINFDEWCLTRVDVSIHWHLRSWLHVLLLRHHHHLLLVRLYIVVIDLLSVDICHSHWLRITLDWLHHLTGLSLEHAGLHLHHLHLLRRHFHHLHLHLWHLMHLNLLGLLRVHCSILLGIVGVQELFFLSFSFRKWIYFYLLIFDQIFSFRWFDFLNSFFLFLLLGSIFFIWNELFAILFIQAEGTDQDDDNSYSAVEGYHKTWYFIWFLLFFCVFNAFSLSSSVPIDSTYIICTYITFAISVFITTLSVFLRIKCTNDALTEVMAGITYRIITCLTIIITVATLKKLLMTCFISTIFHANFWILLA